MLVFDSDLEILFLLCNCAVSYHRVVRFSLIIERNTCMLECNGVDDGRGTIEYYLHASKMLLIEHLSRKSMTKRLCKVSYGDRNLPVCKYRTNIFAEESCILAALEHGH